MSEWSKGTHTERMSRREQWRINGVRMVIGAIINHHNTDEPSPAMSEHYHPTGIPGEIGNVTVPGQLRLVFTQPEKGVGYTDMPDDAA